MQKILAYTQLLIGLVGLAMCGLLYAHYQEPMQSALHRLDRMAADAQIQAEIGSQLLEDWSLIGGDLEQAASVHQQSLVAFQNSSQRLATSLGQWGTSLREASTVASNTGHIARKFSTYLPLSIPDVTVETEDIQIDVPQIILKEQQVQLPYPTVSVGSRTKEIDLGLTSIKLDVPTLEVSTRDRAVSLPATPQVTNQPYRFSVPRNVRVNHQKLLGEEKELLVDAARQLDKISLAMVDSAATLQEVQSLMTHELSASVQAGQENLAHAESALAKLRTIQLPVFQARLQAQREQLSHTQTAFAGLRGIIPWLFAFAALVPLTISLHGLRLCLIGPLNTENKA